MYFLGLGVLSALVVFWVWGFFREIFVLLEAFLSFWVGLLGFFRNHSLKPKKLVSKLPKSSTQFSCSSSQVLSTEL